jgi:hypothetical protein
MFKPTDRFNYSRHYCQASPILIRAAEAFHPRHLVPRGRGNGEILAERSQRRIDRQRPLAQLVSPP